MARQPLPPAEPLKLVTLAEIARGGMGSVELARVAEGRIAGQVLAVKRLNDNIAEDPEFVSMFLDEAWMTAALKHPNVAQVVSWGNDERGMFLGIELVQGISLARLLKEALANQEPFAERTTAFICSQLCAGLTAAHTLTGPDGAPLGLVHRDLSPANVLVSFDGVVKIIDFGIARAEERISHTRTGQLKGKPAYMAPEQQRPGPVDARADLFSLGVLMFELFSGRRPWTQKGAFDVMMAIQTTPPPSLRELRPTLNPEFVAIVEGCLAKKPADRFGSAAEIKARLDAWLAAKGFSADDQVSLQNFVVRNSAPQIKWFEQALRGDFQKTEEVLTFKDLEEQIDAAREDKADKGKKRPPPLRPAAGRPAAGTQAFSEAPAQPAPAPKPMSEPPPDDVSDLEATRMASPGQSLPPPQVGLGGTAFMAVSPFPPSAPLPPPPGPPPAPSPGNPLDRRIVAPAGGSPQSYPAPPKSAAPLAVPAPTVVDAPPKPRRSAGLVALFVVIPLLVAGVVVWQVYERLASPAVHTGKTR